MLALIRTSHRRICQFQTQIRTLADVVNTPPNKSAPLSNSALERDRMPTKEDHGLYGFFRRKEGADLVGDAKYEVVETPDEVQIVTGRAWRASELRLKSFQDLHTLWYVLLRERNLLATQKEEARRMGANYTFQVSQVRVHQCRKSMARIKVVLNERRLAYEGAVKIVEQEKDEGINKQVLEYQTAEYRRERRGRAMRRLRTKKSHSGAVDDVIVVEDAAVSGTSGSPTVEAPSTIEAEPTPQVTTAGIPSYPARTTPPPSSETPRAT